MLANHFIISRVCLFHLFVVGAGHVSVSSASNRYVPSPLLYVVSAILLYLEYKLNSADWVADSKFMVNGCLTIMHSEAAVYI